MQISLYDWAPSPFCLKVRAVLDYKALPYRRVNALAHRRGLRKRGGAGKVPALEIDGRLIIDSTDIVHELEQRVPQPPVIPRSAHERALCHALEDWCDESLYFSGLYYHWCEPAGRAQVRTLFNRTLRGRLAFHWYLPRMLRQLAGQGTGLKTPEHIARDVRRHLDSIEALLADRQFLLGGAPYLCDFALMSQLVYLGSSPKGRAALQGRSAAERFLHQMRALRGEAAA
jgi:glutathione S-transferase